MKKYELTIVYRPKTTLAEMGKVEQIVLEHGSILDRDDAGVKKLTYPILNNDNGHYVYYEALVAQDEAGELCRKLCTADEVLRNLLVRVREESR